MFVLDLLKMMLADFGVSLWTWFCIYGKVLNYLYSYYVHGKLTHASFWDTCHVICAGTPNLFDTLHHNVSFHLLIILGTNAESSRSICCNMLFSFITIAAFLFHTWVASEIAFASSRMLSFFTCWRVFYHRPCFELTAATELLNLVPKILLSDLIFLHRHTLTHRLMTATLLL